MKLYKHEPLVVEAMKLTHANKKEVRMWVAEHNAIGFNEGGTALEIETRTGVVTANPGDYVVRGTRGDFVTVKNDIFKEEYKQIQK